MGNNSKSILFVIIMIITLIMFRIEKKGVNY